MTKPALLSTGPMMPLIADQIEAVFEVHWLHKAGDGDALLAEVGPRIEAICTGGHTGVKTDEALHGQLPKLKIIGNFGVGYDSIDVPAAAKRGRHHHQHARRADEEVADTTLGLLLATVREFSQAENWLRAGRWPKEGDYRLTPASLRDRSVGMVGLGRIGKAIARRLEAFGLPISYFAQQAGRRPYPHYSDLRRLARDVDTLIAILPGGPATQNIVNAEVLQALGPRGILINMARGSVVDEAALIEALKNRTILLGRPRRVLDEPKINPAFLTLDNVTLLPHVGSASVIPATRWASWWSTT